jgi:hypothetical protein
MFLVSFVLVYYMVASVLHRSEQIEMLIAVLAGGGAVLGVFALVESRTGFNVFYHLHTILPFLRFEGYDVFVRNGRFRVFGSSQHPIAYGALFVMILPLAVYLGRTRGRRWWTAAFVILLGALATGSRTAVIMLLAEALVFLRLKPAETKRLWPALVPAVVAIHILAPGSIRSLTDSFTPQGGLIASQTTLAKNADPNLAGGRIRLIRPMIDLTTSHDPLFGLGWGTRVTGFDSLVVNAPILDDQWLGTLVEAGLVGFGIWIWLFSRTIRRLSRAARRAAEGESWLLAGLAASITGCAIGMLTYDSFSFIQTTFVMWILLAIAAAALAAHAGRPRAA